MYFIYVLRSQKNLRLYTGSTDSIERRLSEHNAGHSKATRHVGPFDLLYSESFKTRGEATKRERFLKSGIGRQQLKQLLAEHEMKGLISSSLVERSPSVWRQVGRQDGRRLAPKL